MYLYFLLGLTISAAAFPIENLFPRQATCSALSPTTTTVGGTSYTLTGPFRIQASATTTSKVNGKYAHANSNTFDNVVFGVARASAAQQFYLDETNQLVSIEDDVLYTAYSYLYNNKIPHVAIGPMAHTPQTKLTCSISSSTCELQCTQSGNSYDCLSSPGFQPDWSINSSATKAGGKCLAFTPFAVPV